jgi:hypothetical protein
VKSSFSVTIILNLDLALEEANSLTSSLTLPLVVALVSDTQARVVGQVRAKVWFGEALHQNLFHPWF